MSTTFDPTKYAGAGTEDLPQSRSLPILTIVQKGSPEFDEAHPKHGERRIENVRPGDIVMGGRIIPRPINVIPLASHSYYSEFKPKKLGGGFVANHGLSIVDNPQYRQGAKGSPDEFKEFLGSNELQYTISFLCHAAIEGKEQQVLIQFTATALKAARAWSRLIQGVRWGNAPAAIFAAEYTLTTGPDSNSKGSWMAWQIRRNRVLDLNKDAEALAMLGDLMTKAKETLFKLKSGEDQKALEEGSTTDEEPAF